MNEQVRPPKPTGMKCSSDVDSFPSPVGRERVRVRAFWRWLIRRPAIRRRRDVARMRCALLQNHPQILHQIPAAIGPCQLMIPNPLHQNPVRRQKRIAHLVVSLLVAIAVAGAVQFHGKPCFVAVEVEIKPSLDSLAAKFVSSQASRAQQLPQTFFGPGGLLAQLAGALGGHGNLGSGNEVQGQENFRLGKCRMSPHPGPLPSDGRGRAGGRCQRCRCFRHTTGCVRQASATPNFRESHFAVPSPVGRARVRVRAFFFRVFRVFRG